MYVGTTSFKGETPAGVAPDVIEVLSQGGDAKDHGYRLGLQLTALNSKSLCSTLNFNGFKKRPLNR